MTILDIDIDFSKLDDIAKQFELTPAQINASLRRSVNRAAGTARREIARSKLDIPDLRRTVAIRRRVKGLFRVRGDNRSGGLWIGLNDLWASEFTGRPRQDASGVSFRGHHYKGAFLRRLKGTRKNRIFFNDDGTLREATISIEAEGFRFLEGSVLPQLPNQIYEHFVKDVEARQRSGVGWRRR